MRQVAPGEADKPMARALDLLEQAMVMFRAVPTNSLRSPFVPRKRAAHQLLPLDIGLALSSLGVRGEQLAGRAIESLLDGRVAEAFVGIQLLAAEPDHQRSLHFWTREGSAKSNAEIDYLIQTAAGPIPIEVKSGAAGSLKSLHQYLATSGQELGVRLCASRGSLDSQTVMMLDRSTLRYELRTLPLYLAELLPAISTSR